MSPTSQEQAYVLAIDAGTTGITLLLYGRDATPHKKVHSEFTQHFPKPGWVEHDPEEIWTVTQGLIDKVLDGIPRSAIKAIGITNQRETTVLWDSVTGRPYHKAIVWQCRRTTDICRRLAAHEPMVRARTGLVMDAYFSATKATWILENVPEAKKGADAGTARFGTIDTWLIDRLSGGKLHVTDPTNASRTMLYDIHERDWHPELLDLFGVPRSCLPQVQPSSQVYGMTDPKIFGHAVPIASAVGDQQSALFGQACVDPGSSKNTYGTGCFALVNAGKDKTEARRGCLLTLACDAQGQVVYAHEGSIFVAGALIQWLRDQLQIIRSADETEAIASSIPDSGGVFVIPAFAGLGAPYWDPDARAAILGLTRGSGRAQIVRASLEAIALQTRDLIEALGGDIASLQVDGGACANDFLMQFQADILGVEVVRPANLETTAQGAAWLAGLATGFWSNFEELRNKRPVDRIFKPQMNASQRDAIYQNWLAAVARVRTQGAQ